MFLDLFWGISNQQFCCLCLKYNHLSSSITYTDSSITAHFVCLLAYEREKNKKKSVAALWVRKSNIFSMTNVGNAGCWKTKWQSSKLWYITFTECFMPTQNKFLLTPVYRVFFTSFTDLLNYNLIISQNHQFHVAEKCDSTLIQYKDYWQESIRLLIGSVVVVHMLRSHMAIKEIKWHFNCIKYRFPIT